MLPIGGERPAAVGREAVDDLGERHVEPDRQPVAVDGRTVLRRDEGAAAGGDHEVAQGQLVDQNGAFDGAEIRLAVAREDRGDCASLARLDPLVDVVDPPVETLAEGPRERRLAGGHEPDQVHLVGFHASSAAERLEESGIGDGHGVRAVDDGRPVGAERGDGERHGEAMIAGGVGGAARQPATAADVEAVRELVDVAAERAEPRDERRDAVAFLDAQLRGAGHVEIAAVGGQGGERRQLVDEAGDLVGSEHERAGGCRARIRTRAARLAVFDAVGVTLDLARRPGPSTSNSAVRVGLRPTSGTSTSEPGSDRGGDRPERRRRDVAGHGRLDRAQPLAALERHRRPRCCGPRRRTRGGACSV